MEYGNYDDVIVAAEAGDPHSMILLSKLYKAGAFGDSMIEEYIYWLKAFFETPLVEAYREYLADKYSPGESNCPYPDIPFDEEMILRNEILEAATALGLYYRNSCKKEELECACFYLVTALDAAAWDIIEFTETNGKIVDIGAVLSKVLERQKELGFVTGDYNE